MSVRYSPPPIKITASRTTRGPDGQPIPITVTPPQGDDKPAPAGDEAPAADAAAGDQAPAPDAGGKGGKNNKGRK